MRFFVPGVFVVLSTAALASPSCGPAPGERAPDEVGTVAEAVTGPTSADFTVANGGGLGTAIGAGPGAPWLVGLGNPPHVWAYTGAVPRTWQAMGATITNLERIAVPPEVPFVTTGNVMATWFDGTQRGAPWIVVGETLQTAKYVVGAGNVPQFSTWVSHSMPPGGCVSDIGIGSNEQVWAIGCDIKSTGSTVYSYSQASGTWSSSNGGVAMRIAVSPEGTPWVIDAPNGINNFPSTGGNVFKWNGSAWTVPDGAALGTAIGAGPNGQAWLVGLPAGNGGAWRFNPNGSKFVAASTAFPLQEISVGADGTPWALTTSHVIVRWSGQWQFMGPNGFQSLEGTGTERWSGDIEDIDATDFANNRIVVSTAGGGIFVYNMTNDAWASLGDPGFSAGPAAAIASIAQTPGDPNKSIVAATGLYTGNNLDSQAGNGIWKGSCPAGVGACTWTPGVCSSCTFPPNFTKIRYGNDAQHHLYATSLSPVGGTSGLYISTDGIHFTQTAASLGPVNDFAVDASGILYTATTDGGVEVSSDFGSTFSQSRTFPMTASGIGSAPTGIQFPKLAVFSGTPDTIYVTISGSDASNTNDLGFYGVYKGTMPTTPPVSTPPTWAATSFGYCGGAPSLGGAWNMQSQLGHDGAIAVSPSSVNTVIAAGVKPWLTFNGGGPAFNPNAACPLAGQSASFASFWQNPENLPMQFSGGNTYHNDVHSIAFASDGQHIYLGTDGGMSMSVTGGQTWFTSQNNIPVMNEKSVSVSGDWVLAAAWDVGLHFSTDDGATWQGPSNNDYNYAHLALDANWYALTSPSSGPPSTLQVSTDEGHTFSPVLLAGQGLTNFTQGPNPDAIADGVGSQVFCGGNAGPQLWTGAYEIDGANPRHYGTAGNTTDPQTLAAFSTGAGVPTWVVLAGYAPGDSSTANVKMGTNNSAGYVELGQNLPTTNSAGVGWSCQGGCRSGAIYAIRYASQTSTSGTVYILTQSGRVFADGTSDLVRAYNTQTPANWIEITGNLPGSPVNYHDIKVDPGGGAVIVGTNKGAFRAMNSCVSTIQANANLQCWPTLWQTWDDGFPISPAQVNSQFAGATSAAGGSPGLGVNGLDGQFRSDGNYYMYAATWERGIWVRDVRAGDP